MIFYVLKLSSALSNLRVLYSVACKEPPVSLTFVMLNRILDGVKGEECRENFAIVKGLDMCKEKSVFRIKKVSKYKVERLTNFAILLYDKNKCNPF